LGGVTAQGADSIIVAVATRTNDRFRRRMVKRQQKRANRRHVKKFSGRHKNLFQNKLKTKNTEKNNHPSVMF